MDVTFTWNGRALAGRRGQSIAAALLAVGERGLRRTRDGYPRGVFCGMGVCQECLVVVDGVAGQRACMTKLAPGMAIASQDYRAPVRVAAYPLAAEAPRDIEPCDLLIVGGGASGLSAALAAARAGIKPVLLDERVELGGQFYKQLAAELREAGGGAVDRQMQDGRDLIEAARAAGVTVLSGATVWGAFRPQGIAVEIAAEIGGATRLFAPRQLILAQGAYERGVPMPGWTLPGVMTTGAAQTLLRAYGTPAGRRVLLAGNGPLNLQVGAELQAAGVEVAAVAELAPPPWTSPGATFAMLRHAPDLVRDGILHLARLRGAGVPLLYRHGLVALEGDAQVARAVVARIGDDGSVVSGTERKFDVDAVCMGYGFLPQSELARALGCRHVWNAARGALEVVRGDDGSTSVAGVHVAGDGGGLGGARAARAQGTLAGIAAARALGRPFSPALEREIETATRALAHARGFQAALWQLYRAPQLADRLAAPDTVICRCEEVARRTVDDGAGVAGGLIGAAKRDTRAGMGRCQGRYCGPLLAARVAGGERDLDELSLFAPRTPAKPVTLAAIARREQE
jgi:NADPH-dependent 2,4-dienoyl-CoA reductase/sulfur reductase-like enzyme